MTSGSVGRRRPVSRLPHIIAGYLYIWLWVKRANFRARFGKHFGRGAALLLLFYLLILLGEVILDLMGRRLARNESLIVQGVFFVLIAIAMYSKVSEFREEGQEVYFASAAAEIVRVLNRTESAARDEAVILDLLALFRRTFEGKGVVNANLAFPETDGLRVVHVYPPTAEYDRKLVLPPGTGGSGVCYRDECVVYIPSRHYRHAVVEDFDEDRPYTLVPDCYESCEVERFKSILSVPLLAYGHCYGVLNFDSERRNVFHVKDFAQASFFGFVMAQYLHETNRAATASNSL